MAITREQISKHIEALGRRVLAIEDYPLDEDRLKKWRTDMDTIHADIDRLEFIMGKLESFQRKLPVSRYLGSLGQRRPPGVGDLQPIDRNRPPPHLHRPPFCAVARP
jgi:hypothetical protein